MRSVNGRYFRTLDVATQSARRENPDCLPVPLQTPEELPRYCLCVPEPGRERHGTRENRRERAEPWRGGWPLLLPRVVLVSDRPDRNKETAGAARGPGVWRG